MKKYLLVLALSGFVAFAAGEGKTQTITGKGECAKCSLHETKACQMAVTTKDGKKYLVENNKVSKDFHKNICTEEKNVEVTGKVEHKDGKDIIVAKEIKVAKS